MSENELSKYFTDSTTSLSTSSSAVTFRSVAAMQPPPAASPTQSAQEPAVPVCTLFQSSSPLTPVADPSNFFDLIGNDVTDIILENKPSQLKEENSITDSGRSSLPGRVSNLDRSRAAWIPPEATKRTLIAMVTSPPGTYTQDRDNLTMPGVVLEEDLKDAVTEAVSHYLGPVEALKRKVLTASDVTQDDRGVRSLVKAGCYRAAVNLTRPLLTIYGQGIGRAGHPSKHTVHSIQLWFTRLALLVKLRSFMVADVEAEPFGEMDRPDLFFQFYPELYGGRMGSIVPFAFRLLLAQIPMYIDKHQLCLTKLHKILATVRKMIGNLEKGLLEDGTPCELNEASKTESLNLWRHRETLVLHSIVNCALSFKEYTLAIEVMEMLLARQTDDLERATLHSALGRMLLQLGDVVAAEKEFEHLRKCTDPVKNVRCLVDNGLFLFADGKFKEALNVFEVAVKLDFNNVMILNNMAVCLLYLGKLKEAIQLYENGLRAYPALALNESYLLNLSNLYELQSPSCFSAKLNLLNLISTYRGDNANISCLKLQP